MIHYSTDYVFDGRNSKPYTEEDAPNPLSVYGRTKLAGERAVQAVGAPHLILRTSWVYGLRGSNFLRTILRLISEREELRIVDDQIGSPTWCRMVAEATAHILVRLSGCTRSVAEHQGTYHMSAAGETSWCGFANEILRRAPIGTACRSPHVEPIRSEAYPLPAARPTYSVLAQDKVERVFGLRMPPWELGLSLCVDQLYANESIATPADAPGASSLEHRRPRN